jgi:hypothetical protein
MYMLVTFIYYILLVYIVAKVLGAVLHFFRFIMRAGKAKHAPVAQPRRSSSKMPYTNVEDVDYEDITDKK